MEVHKVANRHWEASHRLQGTGKQLREEVHTYLIGTILYSTVLVHVIHKASTLVLSASKDGSP